MKFRKHNWFDTEHQVEKYGIQAKHPITGQWYYCHDNGTPLIYDTVEERNEKIKELRENTNAVE